MDVEGLSDQAIKRREPEAADDAMMLVDEAGGLITDEMETRRQRRNREDQAAVGGLRNSHASIQRLPGAKACGDRLRVQIDEVVKALRIQADEVLSTLGATDLPESLAKAARCIQDEL